MYQVILSLHIIFMVTWFAGLFYIVRLFVYQREAALKTEEEQKILIPQYQLMSKRLWYGITWPSFILTAILGPSLLYLRPGLLELSYMHIKLSFVLGLFIYHFICHSFFIKLQRGEATKSGNFFRIWNELATLFLVAIVFLVVMKSQVNWIYGTLGFVAFGIILMIAIKIYKSMRS
ncbi:MAG: protoporphyrinogen IX oxidase [Crocinitomix sp.]|nr:protoporphyrinogen IX oxidase [Crocinitomix sp.]